jgi:homoserine dehydrogenase
MSSSSVVSAVPPVIKTLKVGLAGCGTVGQSVLTMLHRQKALFHSLDYAVSLEGVYVRDALRPRDFDYPGAVLTDDPHFLEGTDILIEVMGGVDKPLELWMPHLERGGVVITANKALMAERWDVIRKYVENGQVYFEASVMAGTPIITSLATILRASTPIRLEATLNGTCNYILSQMERGRDYHTALAEAQRLGYAESDPTLDVGGGDSAHKLTLLARMFIDPEYALERVQVRGIDTLPPGAVNEALERGEKIRLLCCIEREDGEWVAKVEPRALPISHPIAQADSSRNALMFTGDECGTVIFVGNGAGGATTASAVVGDLISHMDGIPGPKQVSLVR